MSPPILIVEDSPEDFEATVRALREARVSSLIHRCQDGDEVLEYLHHRGAYSDPALAPRPGLILLDLNLPGTDGREALSIIKSTPALKGIPVIVLTTSSDERDIDSAYQAGANSYIQKPVDMEDYMRLVRLIADYWFSGVILPRGEGER
jgi:CheY-like chemotaxis protein